MKERWMDVLGYDGLYQASDLGRIRSLKYGNVRILKPGKNSCGYLKVGLYKDGKKKTCYVHRLVWEAFNGKIPPGMQINHISEDKTDCSLVNLNLLSPKENTNLGTARQRMVEKQSKGLYQIIPETGQIAREWTSTMECHRHGFDSGAVSQCCNGKRKTHKGFIFRYKECINS